MKPAEPVPSAAPLPAPAHPAPIHCPRCGYDLRHIPEGRCPECGLGFDNESTRWLASDYCEAKLAHLRRMWICGLLAAGCALVAIAKSRILAQSGLPLILCVTVLTFGWSIRFAGWAAIRWGLFFAACGVVLMNPPLARWLAPALIAFGWLQGPAVPFDFDYVELSGDPTMRRRLRNWRFAAWTQIAAAAGLSVLAWR